MRVAWSRWAGPAEVTILTGGFLHRRAKLLLKKKRYREQLLDRTENQISSLEAMVSGAGTFPGTLRP